MKKTFLLLLCCWLALMVGYGNAAAQPANDACANATSLNTLFGQPSNQVQTSTVFTNAAATATTGLTNPACFPDGSTPIDSDVWFTFTGDGGTYFIETSDCDGTANPYITDGDTQIQIYTGVCGALVPVLGGCNEDGPSSGPGGAPPYPAGLTIVTTAGTNYTMMIDGYGASVGQFCIEVTQLPCGNNTCDSGENYATCSNDCPCNSTITFITWPAFDIATTPVIYCPEQLTDANLGYNGGSNETPAIVYIPFVVDSDNELVSTPNNNNDAFGTLTTTNGDLYRSTSPPSPNATDSCSRFIHFLRVNQADIDAGATTTITFDGLDDNCGATITINWADVVNANAISTQCTPCNDNAGTLTGPSQVCFGESFTITSVGATFDPTSVADGILYGIFAPPGPSAGFENDVTNDPNFVDILGDNSNSIILNNIFSDGGSAVIAPITYEGLNANNQYILGNCHHVGTGFSINFIPEITINGLLSCNLDLTVSGGDGTDGYNYTLAGPAPSTAQVTAGNTLGSIFYSGAAGDYTLNLTDVATGCTETYTVVIAANNDSAGDASGDNGDGAALSIAVCYDGDYSIMTEGASVGNDDSLFSNILGWGISTADPAGDINVVDVAFIPTASPADILGFVNDGSPLTGAFNPDGTAFTGSLTPGNTYYFTPFTMFDLPGTPLGIQTPGTTFGANGNGSAAAGYNPNTGTITDINEFIDVMPTFYVDGADPSGAGFSIDNLCFDITHPWVGDLEIYLLSPEETLIQLFSIDPNANGNNFTACFVSSGGTAFVTTCADPNNCYTGNLTPAAPMLFAGENPNGFWRIIINDTFGDGDPADGGGILNSWSATVSGGSIWDANGNFPFPVWDSTCYLAGNSVEVVLLTDLDVVASSSSCNFSATVTGGDIANGGTWEVTNASNAVVATGTVSATGTLSGTLSADGNYSIVVTDQNGCQSADTFTISGCTVTEICPDIVDFSVSASQVCAGTSVTLCAEVDLGTFAGVGVVFSDGTNTYTGVSNGNPTVHTVQVGQGGLNFSPATVNAQVGDVIRWVWASGFHTTTSSTIPAGATAWNQTLNGAGQQFDYTVTQVGTYNYVCTPHESAGMVGSIVVAPAAATYCADVTLTNGTCQPIISNFTATFVGSTIGDCTNEVAGPLGVTTYPSVSIVGTNGTCSASAAVTCPNWTVSYTTSGGASGNGTSYTAEAGESGTVTFTVTQSGAPAGCATATATATYNCPSNECSVLDDTQAVGTANICSGGTVQYTEGGVTNNDFTGGTVAWVYGTSAGFDAYTAGTAFTGTLPANTGCTPTTYFLKARLDGVTGCQDVSDEFTVMVYPAITATPQNGTCSASVSIGGGCTDYSVSYTTSGGQSGIGSSFSVTPSTTAQSGTVTFTVSNPNAPAGCNSATVTANYDCAALVCSALNGLQEVFTDNGSICNNTSVLFNEGSVVNNDFTGGTVAMAYSTDENFDPYTEGTEFTGLLPSNTGCDPVTYYIKFYLDGVAACEDVSEAFMVRVFPPMTASLAVSSDECPTFSLTGASVDCGYTVLWEDSNGSSGTGAYTPIDGTLGTVLFTIQTPFIAQNPPAGCSTLVFTASFNCSDFICSELDNGFTVGSTAICSGGAVSFTNGGIIDNDFTGGSSSWVYGTTAGFNAYSSAAQAFTGTLPANTGCTPTTYFIKARLDGVTGCQDVSQEFSVMVYPAISATVSGDQCSATLATACSGFGVTWTSTTGDNGSGSSYDAAEGEAGTVTFTVTQSGAPESCNSATFTYDFDCPLIVCSTLDGNQNVGSTAICSGGFIEYTEGGVNDNSFSGGTVTWVYSTTAGFDVYATGTTFTGTLPNNTSCAPITYHIKARLDGVEGCQDVSDEFTVTVWPAIEASVMTSDCSVMLMSACDYTVMWTNLATGETGSGNMYFAESGEQATISFEAMQTGAPSGCSSLTLTGDVDCPDEPVCTPNEAGVCSLSLLAGGASGRVDVCAGDGVQATAEGVAVNNDTYEAGFILFSSPDGEFDNPEAEVIETNTDGLFVNTATYPTNTTLYICSAVLLSPFGTNYSGLCRVYSNAEEVAFYEPIIIEVVSHDCDALGENYTVTMSISGGNGEYFINGNPVDAIYTSELIPSGGSYTFMVMDGNNCMGSVSGENLCEMPQMPPVVENANFTISLLAGAVSYNLNDFASDLNGDPLSFEIVSVVPSDLGTLDFDPLTGEMTYTPDSDAAGQSVVITFTVTDGMSDPVEGTITLNITDQLTCDVLAPIEPHIAVTIDPSGTTYSYYIYASGGIPDVDQSSYLVSLSDGNNFTVDNLLLPWGDVVLGTQIVEEEAFTLTMTVTDGLGCTATTTAYVNVTLPVELLSFTGEVLAEGNQLQWATASETNNHHFTLERSIDGVNYQTIATVAAAGNSNISNSYAHLDKDAAAGLSYYRLSQTDLDGITHYVAAITLLRGEMNTNTISVSPIPTFNNIQVSFATANTASSTAINIYDIAGRLIETQVVDAGNNSATIDVQHYAAGTYFVSVNNAGIVSTAKFVKQ